MTPLQAGALGTLLGIAQFYVSEANQPPESNCSYLAPISTDIGAFAAAGILAWQAKETGSSWVAFVAGAITGIHVLQVVHFKMT